VGLAEWPWLGRAGLLAGSYGCDRGGGRAGEPWSCWIRSADKDVPGW